MIEHKMTMNDVYNKYADGEYDSEYDVAIDLCYYSDFDHCEYIGGCSWDSAVKLVDKWAYELGYYDDDELIRGGVGYERY